ncbi:hypothetical protein [Streptomyces sp. NPDC059455]|uniref:hypothetical protein n=1 Tax=Streptomyces sp. NPDC059455 TaxID=3346837 RepID=UPI0036955529
MTLHAETIRVTGLTAEHTDEVLAICQLGSDERNAAFESALPAAEERLLSAILALLALAIYLCIAEDPTR